MIIVTCEMQGCSLRVVLSDRAAPVCEKHHVDATGKDSWRPHGTDASTCKVLAAILHKVLISDASDLTSHVDSQSGTRTIDVGWMDTP